MMSRSVASCQVATCSYSSLFTPHFPLYRHFRIAWISVTHAQSHPSCQKSLMAQSALFAYRVTGTAFKLSRTALRQRLASWSTWILADIWTSPHRSCDKFTQISWQFRSKQSSVLWAIFAHQTEASGQRKLPIRFRRTRLVASCRRKSLATPRMTCRKSICSLQLPRM